MDHPLISDIDKNYLKLKWIPTYPTKTAQTYTIEMSEPPYSTWHTIASGIPDTEFLVRNIDPDQERWYRVRAEGVHRLGDPSEPISTLMLFTPARDIVARKRKPG